MTRTTLIGSFKSRALYNKSFIVCKTICQWESLWPRWWMARFVWDFILINFCWAQCWRIITGVQDRFKKAQNFLNQKEIQCDYRIVPQETTLTTGTLQTLSLRFSISFLNELSHWISMFGISRPGIRNKRWHLELLIQKFWIEKLRNHCIDSSVRRVGGTRSKSGLSSEHNRKFLLEMAVLCDLSPGFRACLIVHTTWVLPERLTNDCLGRLSEWSSLQI